MTTQTVAVDRAAADLAVEMIALFGPTARDEAFLRARKSRDAGNACSYRHWRQAVRLIDMMLPVTPPSTFH